METKSYKFYFWLLLFLKFLVPFALWNAVFSNLTQWISWPVELDNFYKNWIIKTLSLFFFVSSMFIIILIENLAIKKMIIIKSLLKFKENPEAKKIFWIHYGLYILFFIPILSILSELYYNSKKEKILTIIIIDQQIISKEYLKIVESYKWVLLMVSFLIPYTIYPLIGSIFPDIFWWNKGLYNAFKSDNVYMVMSITVITFILISLYFYLENSLLRRNSIFKEATKNNPQIAKMHLKWKLMHILFIVPVLAMLPEIYYQMNKTKIESFLTSQEAKISTTLD